MANTQLPAHIRQLVDKNNFVIAIKTLSQEQNISLDQAKAQIDAYEASKVSPTVASNQTAKPPSQINAADSLNHSLDSHLQQENIKLPLMPYWVKRVAVILLIIVLLFWVMWRLFSQN